MSVDGLLYFHGIKGTPTADREEFLYKHEVGKAVLHGECLD